MFVGYEESFELIQRSVKTIVGEQTALSHPIPDIVGDGIFVEHYFIYPAGTSLFAGRPFAQITIDMKTGMLLAYKDCRVEDFMDQDKHPLSEVINYELPEKLTVQKYIAQQSLINKLYKQVREFVFNESLTEKEQEVFRKYIVLVLNSVPKALVPYYKKLGKKFYDWGYENV